MSAIIFVTAAKPVKVSVTFLVGVSTATIVGLAVALASSFRCSAAVSHWVIPSTRDR